jgi:hypothetical protein
MRGAGIVAAVLVVGGVVASPARAGVYNTAEPWPLPGNFNLFQLDLAGYRAAAAAEKEKKDRKNPNPLRERYDAQVQELEASNARGLLRLEDRINLGAYYIRLGEYEKAIRVLEPMAQQSRHFMLRANLATAYELAGQPERAVGYRQLALASWPTTYPGWDSVQLRFYRKAEQYHLTLLQLRQEEARLDPSRTRLQLDRLFPRVRFVGANGEYEVGGIAPAQWVEIPADASVVVMQLLLWLPFDDRLHWLLGELLNASGDVVGAAAMMKPVLYKPQDPAKPDDVRKWDAGAPPELREHYRLLAAEAAAREKFAEEVKRLEVQDPNLNLNLTLLCALAPRGMGLGAGDLLQEASWPALLVKPPEVVAPPAPSPPAAWVPNWRQIAVGFGAGAVVALLLGMQFRQMGRSRG